jgi:hypothetical protein
MKAIWALTIVLSLLTASQASADNWTEPTANNYLRGCRGVVAYFAHHEPPKTMGDAVSVGNCMGVMTVVRDSSAVFDVPADFRSCPPPNVTVSQATAVVVRWLDQLPERWNEEFVPLAIRAMHDAWPCKQ